MATLAAVEEAKAQAQREREELTRLAIENLEKSLNDGSIKTATDVIRWFCAFSRVSGYRPLGRALTNFARNKGLV